MSRTPLITVIVVNFNGGTHLRRCLQALAHQACPTAGVIVVDNASTDGSANGIEACHPHLTLVRAERNLGFAAGNNLGLRHSGDAEWVALLNPDAFAHPDWLEKLLAAAQAHPEFRFFGSRMRLAGAPRLLDGTGDVHHVSGVSWRRDHGVAVARGVSEPGEIFGPCAAAAMYSRAALEEVGGFDEAYFCYHEDVDLAFRLRLRGYRCWYAPEAIVDHVSSGIAGRRSDFATYYGQRNLVWTYVKNMPGALFWLYLPWHLLANLAGIAVCAARGQLIVALRAKLDALRGLPRALAQRRDVQAARRVRAGELLAVMARGLRPLLARGRS